MRAAEAPRSATNTVTSPSERAASSASPCGVPAARRARRGRRHELGEEPAGGRPGRAGDLLRRARRHERAALVAALRPHVDDPVGGLDDVEVVLNHHDAVAGIDEPTTGLHFADIEKLLEVLQTLVDQGNTVVVIEHNLDVIKTADRLIDMGPEGGEEGGFLMAAGTPEEVAAVPESATGRFLAGLVEPKAARSRAPRRKRVPAAA
jgi:hypothetical protein